jgi:hypothetical protein
MDGGDRWTFSENCSAFAIALWNTVAGPDAVTVKGVVTPNKLKREIEKYDGVETNRAAVAQREPGYFGKDGGYIEAVLKADGK